MSWMMRSIVCESMLAETVAMESQTALRAAWLCGRAWFLETRLLCTVHLLDTWWMLKVIDSEGIVRLRIRFRGDCQTKNFFKELIPETEF